MRGRAKSHLLFLVASTELVVLVGPGSVLAAVADPLPAVGRGQGAVLGAAGGALLGFLVAPGAEWRKGAPPDHVRVSLWPTPGQGMRLSVSLAF